MSSIVKSGAVVDNRLPRLYEEYEKKQPLAAPVLKPGGKDCFIGPAPLPPGRTREEMALLRAELADAKREIGKLRQQLQEQAAREESVTEEAGRQALERAEKILAKAVEQGRAVTEELRVQGYQEGLTQGRQAGLEEVHKEYRPKAQALETLLRELADFQEERLRQNREELIELSFAIASKVIGREIARDSQVAQTMLAKNLADNRREAFVQITLGPGLAPVEAKAEQGVIRLLEQAGEHITVRVNREAPEGSCLVETPGGCVDMSIPVQLENIKEALLA